MEELGVCYFLKFPLIFSFANSLFICYPTLIFFFLRVLVIICYRLRCQGQVINFSKIEFSSVILLVFVGFEFFVLLDPFKV